MSTSEKPRTFSQVYIREAARMLFALPPRIAMPIIADYIATILLVNPDMPIEEFLEALHQNVTACLNVRKKQVEEKERKPKIILDS